jgi:hypothetical protein
MRERPNRTVSKTVVAQATVGSNPTPSAPDDVWPLSPLSEMHEGGHVIHKTWRMKKRIVALALAGAIGAGIAVPVESAFGTSAEGCASMVNVYNTIVTQYNAATDPNVKAALFKGGAKLRRKLARRCGV